jgi:hypothetical protein
LLAATMLVAPLSYAGDAVPTSGASMNSIFVEKKWSIAEFCDDCREMPATGQVFERAIIDPTSLPEGSVPAPLAPPEAARPANGAPVESSAPAAERGKSARKSAPKQVDGLELDVTKADLATFLRKGASESISIRLRPADRTTTVLSAVRDGAVAPADSDGEVGLYCGPLGEVPIRWQRFRFAPDGGGAEVEIDDGWFDQRTCSSRLERTTTVPAAVIVRREDRPVLLGLREHGSLILMAAPGTAAAANSFDDNGVAVESTALVGVPWGAGRSSAATFHLARETARGAKQEDEPHTISVEVSQTVTETAPTVLVELASTDFPAGSRHRVRPKIMLR